MIQYIGLPYSFKDFNCWDFVAKVRSDNGLHCELFRPKKLREAYRLIKKNLEKAHAGFKKVDDLKNFDILIAEKEMGKNSIFHCGIYVDGLIFHCDRDKNQVSYNSLSEFSEQYKKVTFWR